VDGKLLDGRKEVVGDYMFKWSVKNTLSLGFLDGFSGLITLISLILCHLTNVRDVFNN